MKLILEENNINLTATNKYKLENNKIESGERELHTYANPKMTLYEFYKSVKMEELDDRDVYDNTMDVFGVAFPYYHNPVDGYENFVKLLGDNLQVVQEEDNGDVVVDMYGFIKNNIRVFEKWLSMPFGIRNIDDKIEYIMDQLNYAVSGNISYSQGNEFVRLFNNKGPVGESTKTRRSLRTLKEMKAKTKKKSLKENFFRNMLEFPNGTILYVYRNGDKLIAGSATNEGIIPEFEVDYDSDYNDDWNLQNLYDTIINERPELMDDYEN